MNGRNTMLIPVICSNCGKFLTELPAGASVYHCKRWHEAKQPEPKKKKPAPEKPERKVE